MTTELAQAEAICDDLENACQSLMADAVVYGFFSDEAATNAVKGVCRQVSDRLIRLRPDNGDLWVKVKQGSWSYAQWKADAQNQRQLILSVASDYKLKTIPSFGRLWDEVVTPSAVTISDSAIKVAEKVDTAFWPLIAAVVVIVIGVAVIKVA